MLFLRSSNYSKNIYTVQTPAHTSCRQTGYITEDFFFLQKGEAKIDARSENQQKKQDVASRQAGRYNIYISFYLEAIFQFPALLYIL